MVWIVRKSARYKDWIILGSLMFCLVACSSKQTVMPLPESDTVRVQKTVFVNGVEDVGVIKALRSASVIVEVDGKIARMVPEGTLVKEGDPVLWMDDQDIRKEIESETINLKQHTSELDRARESLSESRFNLEQTLKERQANHQFDVLNVQRAETEVQRLEDRFNRQLIPETELLAARDELERKRLKENSSRLALVRSRAEYDSKIKSMQTDLSIAQQEYERSQFRMVDLQTRHKKMIVNASADGIAVIKRNWRKEQFKVGDRVWPGIQAMEIPDLSEFQVWTQVPEVHFQRISVDQPVSIRLPALENLQLNGRVKSVSWLAMPRVQSRGTGYTSEDSSEGGQVFEVLVSLTDTDDRLKTGMNVSVVFVEEQVDSVLIVPVSALATDEKGSYVFLVDGDRFAKRYVQPGPGNRSDVVIEDGLKEGNRIAVFNPGRRA